MAISALIRTEVVPYDSAPALAGLSVSSLVYDAYNTAVSLNSGTVPPVTKTAVFVLTLTAGAATIDLTSLTHNGVAAAVTFSGLKVQSLKFQNPNGNKITLTKGASNGYCLVGTDTWTHGLPGAVANAPLPEFTHLGPEGPADVDGTHKTIDVSGTGTDTLYCTLVAG